MRQRPHKRTRSVVGRQGDSVELMLGGNWNLIVTLDASMRDPKRNCAAVSDVGLRRIAEIIADHLGLNLVPR